MNVERVEAAFWAAFLRNRNVDAASAGDGAVAVAGGFALCATGTFLEYAIGAGEARPLRDDDLAAVADFYGRRGLPPCLEVTETVLQRDRHTLEAAGYSDDAIAMAVLEAPVPDQVPESNVVVRPSVDRRAWAQLVVRATRDTVGAGEHARLLRATHLNAVAAHGLFVAYVDGAPAGAAAAFVSGDLLFCYSAAVLPAFRGRGAHRALIAARVEFGRSRGARAAALKAIAGSPSEFAAQAQGFQRSRLRRRVRAAS